MGVALLLVLICFVPAIVGLGLLAMHATAFASLDAGLRLVAVMTATGIQFMMFRALQELLKHWQDDLLATLGERGLGNIPHRN